jgi:hypothetical protein
LKGSELVLDDDGTGFTRWREEPFSFVGRTLEQVTIPFKLPPVINEAFTYFRRWNPVVHGQTIWRALSGEQHVPVTMSLAHGSLHQVTTEYERFLTSKPDVLENKFAIDGATYQIKDRCCVNPSFRHVLGGRVFEEDAWVPFPHCYGFEIDWHLYSVDLLCSWRPDEIKGTRISLFDLVNKQARPLYRVQTYPDRQDALRLKAAGFDLVWIDRDLQARWEEIPLSFDPEPTEHR